MNDIILNDKIKIEDMIYEIRGKQIMLDSDLARLYQVETKRINEAIRNNPDKFPERFSWIVTEKAVGGSGKYRKYLPRVVTEQGVAMLAMILKSKIATEVSIRIMDAFVAIKKYISSNLIEQNYINNLVLEHEDRLKIVENIFTGFKDKNNHLFFKGQIYDAYSLLIDIFNTAKDEIIIIDKKVLYHSGASFKNLRKNCFEISKILGDEILDNLLKKI